MTAVSLIIATLAQTSHLPRLAHSLAAQGFRDFEVIVVNQGPDDAIKPFLALLPSDLSVKVLRSEKGLSRARNVGLRAAQGRIVGFPDDDAWYPAGLLAQVVGLFDAYSGLGIISGVTRDEHGNLSNGTFLENAADLDRDNVWKAGNSNGIFALRADLIAVNGFDERLGVGSGTEFGSGEETEILLRMLAKGSAGRFLPDLVVHHDQVDTAVNAATLRRARLYAAGYGQVLRLHGYSPRFAGYRAARSLAAAGMAALRGQPTEARRRLIWMAGILRGYRASTGAETERKMG